MSVVLGILDFGATEMIIVGIVAVLLFGERLPEVGRSFGKKFVEFKKGLRGIEEELASITREISSPSSVSSSTSMSTHSAASVRNDVDDYAEATAPKFEPPPAEPKGESAGA